ncbi:hypothetical protein [Paenibacillus ginsengihumi]|uniref:hypothetical protein n=1 Tax=Paenibacillus ginsengihumi TaxID=431596 RepID=UPI00037C5A37|nr:hypothetical protein [Paenibacillus ginsengihumi]
MRYTVRLNVDELMKAAIDKNLSTDTELAAAIGVSTTQVWRAKLPVNHPKHNSPGVAFIAGVMAVFGGPFDRFFFLQEVIRERIT